MSKIISVVVVVLLGAFIVKQVKDIIASIKAKRKQKLDSSKKECGSAESKEV